MRAMLAGEDEDVVRPAGDCPVCDGGEGLPCCAPCARVLGIRAAEAEVASRRQAALRAEGLALRYALEGGDADPRIAPARAAQAQHEAAQGAAHERLVRLRRGQP